MSDHARLSLFRVRDLVTGAASAWAAADRLIALCVADHMGAEDTAFPSVRRISEWCGLSERRVRTGVRRLTTGPAAPFTIEQSIGRSANTYRLAAPTRQAVPGSTRQTVPGSESQPGTAFPPTRQPVPSNPARRAPQPGTTCLQNDSLNDSSNGSLNDLPAAVAAGDAALVVAPVSGTNGNGAGNEMSTALAVRAAEAEVVTAKPWSVRACDAVIAHFGGTAPGGRIGRALKPLVARHGEEAVLAAFARYLDATEPRYFSPESFATTFGVWSGTAVDPRDSALRGIAAFAAGGKR